MNIIEEQKYRSIVDKYLQKYKWVGGYAELVNEVVAKVNFAIDSEPYPIEFIALSPITYVVLCLHLLETNPGKYKNSGTISIYERDNTPYTLILLKTLDSFSYKGIEVTTYPNLKHIVDVYLQNYSFLML